MSNLETEKLLTGDDRIIQEAKRRFQQCEKWESNSRKLFLDDLKFADADSDNGYQWPNAIRRNRDVDERPCLTINKTRQHNLQIINDAKQNKPSVKVRATGNGSTQESADVIEGIVRHIEYISSAQAAYDTATGFQVKAGIGYWRVVTDYIDGNSFDQEIFIRRIKDPLTVYLDPDINEADGSDARFSFIFDDMSKEEFEEAYPEYKDKVGQSALGSAEGWIDDDHVRVAEYYRRVPRKDKLLAFKHPSTGEQHIMRAGELPKEIAQPVIDDPQTRIRDIVEHEVEWFLIVGEEIAERRKWAGQYIPVVRVVGEETIIDGELDRKGHTRALKDPQRMYNYFSSSAVEFIALQGKSPYITPAAAIEGYETYWSSANKIDHAVLPYKHIDDEGNPIPAPERAQPPTQSTGYLQAMQTAQQEMMMVSGQYQSDFGEKSNEISGKAISARQRQGDNATYHFIDNQAIAIRYTGKILIDLIPKIYDTERVQRIFAEDGTESHIMIDPNAAQAYFEKQQQIGDEVRAIFNPNVGKYDVQADIGPAYATRREEAFNAFSQIAAQNPDLMHIIGDLLFKNMDVPGAEELAERMRRMVPLQALDKNASPELQSAHAQLTHVQGLLTQMTQELAEEKLKLKGKDQMRDIDVYKAVTDRMQVLIKEMVNPKDIAMMLHDLMKEEHKATLSPVINANADDLALESEDNGAGMPPTNPLAGAAQPQQGA